MLNGIAPILIFHFYPDVKGPTFSAIAGIPLIGSFVNKNVGIPIPLYLDKQLTGILVENESKGLDIDTDVQQSYDPKVPTQFTQRGVTSLVSVNMVAERDSIVLATLLALNDMVFQKVVAQDYAITYLNGPTTVFQGLLHGFSSTVGNDDNLFRIVLQISKANGKTTVPNSQVAVISKQTSLTPTPGVGL